MWSVRINKMHGLSWKIFWTIFMRKVLMKNSLFIEKKLENASLRPYHCYHNVTFKGSKISSRII